MAASVSIFKNLNALMSSQPPKGFEKFFKDKKKTTSQDSEPPKEASSQPKPSKSASAKPQDGIKKEFEFKFQIPSSGKGQGKKGMNLVSQSRIISHGM